MSGHVFLVGGDVTRLHCDAWLLPTDAGMQVVGDFARAARAAGVPLPLDPWRSDEPLMRPLGEPASGAAQIWLGRVGGVDQPAAWYGTCVASFVAAAAEPARERALTGRAKPLLATPVIGTRFGGGRWDERGDILRALIRALTIAASEHDVDVALVTWGADEAEATAMYAASQRARRRELDEGSSRVGWDLGPRHTELVSAAQICADHARSGRLVLFLGAGVSAGSGLPTWQGLIDDLATQVGIDATGLARLHDLDLRDQATVILRRSGDLRAQVTARLQAASYPLTGALLASLPSREAITTNYDELFEAAVAARKEDLAVLPYASVNRPRQRWLLKLHGSVASDADGIVLTRDDYLGAPSRHAALFGLVQAMLLTRHMLFVGYSLSDEDFHQIVHDVKNARAIPGDEPRQPLGTALVLHDDDLQRTLWGDVLDVVPVGGAVEGTENIAAATVAERARTLQIFLDLVAFLAADLSGFVLAEGFGSLLDREERAVADALEQLASLEVADPHLREKVGEVLRLFGGTIAPTRPAGHVLRRDAASHRHLATCREEILSAFERLERRHGRRVFSPGEIIQEVTASTDRYPEQTIRTEIVSRMCADAPVHHATAYEDLERVSRGQYRRRSPAAPQPGTEAAGDNPPHSAPG